MRWNDLGVAVSLYNEVGGTFPSEPLNPYEETYTETVANPTPESIVIFLNKWGKMRMYFDARLMKKAMEQAEESLVVLKTCFFDNSSLEDIHNSITLAFDSIQKGTHSPVATSKTLHILRPNLFVPWDNAIRTAYGCGDNSDPHKAETWGDTYFIFLNRVQKAFQGAIMSYTEERQLQDISTATAELRKKLYAEGKKPFAKIIDEYNFMKFTKGKDPLWL